jgi:hypothetical protein
VTPSALAWQGSQSSDLAGTQPWVWSGTVTSTPQFQESGPQGLWPLHTTLPACRDRETLRTATRHKETESPDHRAPLPAGTRCPSPLSTTWPGRTTAEWSGSQARTKTQAPSSLGTIPKSAGSHPCWCHHPGRTGTGPAHRTPTPCPENPWGWQNF